MRISVELARLAGLINLGMGENSSVITSTQFGLLIVTHNMADVISKLGKPEFDHDIKEYHIKPFEAEEPPEETQNHGIAEPKKPCISANWRQ